MYDKLIKFRHVSAVLLIGLLFCLGAGCEPEDYPQNSSKPTESKASTAQTEEVAVSLKALSAIDFICTGNFPAAQDVLKTNTQQSNGATNTLLYILNDWQTQQNRRKVMELKVLDEQQNKLKELQEKLTNPSDTDVNDLDAALAIALRLQDLAPEDEKQEILNNPFIQRTVRAALEHARVYEEQGKWTDAYIHAYYWLTSLYDEDSAYREKADQLTEMVGIELALKDGACDDTVKQRYADIQPEMFLRALHLLESNYVHPLYYNEMIDQALQRCRLLSQVLKNTSEDLVVKAKPDTIEQYQNGLAQLTAELDQKEQENMGDLIQLFDEVLTLNDMTLELPREVMIAQFSEAVLQSLDPFTDLVWPWYVRDFEKNLTQQFSGIGVEISKSTGVLTVVSLLPDTPAYRAGLDAYDEILAVNGESTDEMTIFCAVSKITGKKGTKVTLTVRRPSTGEVKDYTIVRDRIVVQPIRGWQRTENGQWNYWVDPGNQIGYVRLTSFTETSQDDLDRVLTKLEKEGMRALILDLRYNSGGYLNSAAGVADLFVSEGVIVKSNPRNGFATYDFAHKKGTHPDYPMVILINGGSASASEIVAGALQDPKFNRATLVGTRSYGKGSVQVVTPYTGDGSQLKYTIAYYHLPSDQQVKNRYQMEKLGRKDWGIAPDVEVKMYSHELRRMLDVQRENDVLVQVHNGTHPSPQYDLAQTLLSDPQLTTGILVTQAKMLQQGLSVRAMDPVLWQRAIDPNEIQ